MLRLVVVAALVALAAEAQLNSPVRGVQCSRNQSVNKLTVYEDGAIEAECGPIPCGRTTTCADEMATSCKPETELYAGMRWAKNGQSLLLRCCGAEFPSKTYIGTDLVPLGSYYVGGLVAKKDMFTNAGPEYDYVANVRMEQGGLRVWVYRILCPVVDAAPAGVAVHPPPPSMPADQFATDDASTTTNSHRNSLIDRLNQQQQQQAHATAAGTQPPPPQSPLEVAPSNDESVVQLPSNPLQYRPTHMTMAARQRDSPLPAAQRVL